MGRHHNPRDRATVVQWAQSLFEQRNFYILDTETTGVGKRDEVVQIGIVDKHGETVFDSLIKPTQPISSGASAVNGITNAMVVDAPPFEQVYTTLSAKLAGAILIAYNMDFDWRMLSQSASAYSLPMFRTGQRHCAMKQYAKFRGVMSRRGYRWHKLTEAAAYEQITVANAHTAVGDVVMTLELIRKMAEG